MAAALNSIASPPRRSLPLPRPIPSPPLPPTPFLPAGPSFRRLTSRRVSVPAPVAALDPDVIPVQSADSTDHQDGMATLIAGRELEEDSATTQVGGFAFENGGVGEMGGGGFSPSPLPSPMDGDEVGQLADRAINAAIVLAAGTFAITKLLTIDHDYWHVSWSKTKTRSLFSYGN